MVDNGFPSVAPVSEQQAFQILRPQRRFNPATAFDKRSSTNDDNGSDVETDDFGFSSGQKKGKKGQKKNDKRKVRPGSYEALGLSSSICNALQNAGYNFPTPIQRKVIPAVLAGDDVVAMARTGSGKTAAFLAPLLHLLSERPRTMSSAARRNGPRALVIAPTRELVLQELKFCNLYGKKLDKGRIRVAVVVGGTPLDAQFQALAVCPDIIFATPGRLLQIVTEMSGSALGSSHNSAALTLSTTEILVLDEADRLFEGTLAVETSALLQKLRDGTTETLSGRLGGHGERQSILVSATMPHALKEFSQTGLRKCLSVVRLDADKSMSPTAATAFLHVRAHIEKDAALSLLCRRVLHSGDRNTAVIFAATHRRVEYLVELLRSVLLSKRQEDIDLIGCIHGSMDQLARQETVSKFRKRKTKVLVVTDVAARGIDLPDLDVVINYDMPATPKLFIHRTGRVGRAGRFGCALNLVSADELPYMLDVLLYLGREVSFAKPMMMTNHENIDNKSVSEKRVENTFASNAYCMDSTFTFGVFPKSVLDEEVESVKSILQAVELDKAHTAAKNAQKLYVKTRGTPGGESVRRAKQLLVNEDGSRIPVHVHPWFSDMDSQPEMDATVQVALLSKWRPKECAVAAPSNIIARKQSIKASTKTSSDAEDDYDNGVTEDNEDDSESADGMDIIEKDDDDGDQVEQQAQLSIPLLSTTSSQTRKQSTSKQYQLEKPSNLKFSSRRAAIDEERRQFFMPTQLDASRRREARAMSVRGGGDIGGGGGKSSSSLALSNGGDNFGAYRELNDAVMDINADANEDLLRANHLNSKNNKYWDRVSKKFVRGGVTDATSKRNLHVASREAKARAQAGQNYGSEDGALFRKWLSKNRKAVEELSQRVDVDEDGNDGGSNGGGENERGNGITYSRDELGLGSNDFRKGAFGRKGRIRAAAAAAAMGSGGTGTGAGAGAGQGRGRAGGRMKPELKAREEIIKERKLKAKAEARRKAHAKNKRGAGAGKKDMDSIYKQSNRGSSKSRAIIRRK